MIVYDRHLTLPEIEALWNAQADHRNQWSELGEDEIVEFVQKITLARIKALSLS